MPLAVVLALVLVAALVFALTFPLPFPLDGAFAFVLVVPLVLLFPMVP